MRLRHALRASGRDLKVYGHGFGFGIYGLRRLGLRVKFRV